MTFFDSLGWGDLSGAVAGFFGRIEDLSAAVFWDVATSMPVLTIIAAIGAVAFLVARIPAIAERLFPVLIPYTRMALLVQVAAFAALAFLLGFRVADDRAETEKLKNELAWSEFQLEEHKAATDVAEQLKQKAEAEAADARGELNEYREKFGGKAGGCDPAPGYPDWLRSLQRRPAHRAAAKQQPNLVERVRALGQKRR